ncbi:unnamed protein product, partial [Staurois parvus]
QDPAFTISGLPQYTWKRNYFSKYKLLNNFFHQQLEQSSCEHWLNLVGRVFILL